MRIYILNGEDSALSIGMEPSEEFQGRLWGAANVPSKITSLLKP